MTESHAHFFCLFALNVKKVFMGNGKITLGQAQNHRCPTAILPLDRRFLQYMFTLLSDSLSFDVWKVYPKLVIDII